MHKLLVATLMLFVFSLGAMAQEKSAQPKEKDKATHIDMKHTEKAATPAANEGMAEHHKADAKHQHEGKHEEAKQPHKQSEAAHKPPKTAAEPSAKTKEPEKK